MEKIAWDDKYKIGVEVVDKAHEKLFRIVNRLFEIPEDDMNYQHTYKEGIKYLEAYSMKHFLEEETYMRSIKYLGYTRHKKIHDTFRDKTLVSLKKDLELSNYSVSSVQRFVGIMSNWLVEHIMREDQAIVGKVFSPQGRDLSSQIAMISRAVNRATTELFQVEVRLVNPLYQGRNIGEAYYCHQCFDVEGGVKLQILLGVEESLILRGVKRLRKNQITPETLLQIFELLFENISRLFRAEPEEKLSKEKLLTLEEFRADFMKGYPCSLLFSNKVGHFAFCYRNWRVRSAKG